MRLLATHSKGLQFCAKHKHAMRKICLLKSSLLKEAFTPLRAKQNAP